MTARAKLKEQPTVATTATDGTYWERLKHLRSMVDSWNEVIAKVWIENGPEQALAVTEHAQSVLAKAEELLYLESLVH